MICGMTGFSTRAFVHKDKRWIITIRSVNHKFLDCVINLPDELLAFDEKIKKILQKSLYRGRIVVQLITLDSAPRKLILNEKLLVEYLRCMNTISKTLSLRMDIGVSDIMRLPEVVSLRIDKGIAGKSFLSVFSGALHSAVNTLIDLRKKEGRAMYYDLRKRIQTIRAKLNMIRARVKNITKEHKKRLSNEELREFLKNYNIQEEVTRLQFHLTTFLATLSETGSLGKILDFMAQEMQREVNTLSAKFRDTRVSYLSVLIKDEIEKIREQVQNVE